MKKIILLMLMIIFITIGAFTLFDISQSIWYVFSLEAITAMSAGLIFGKIIFLIIIILGVHYLLKAWRNS
ncbi:MULTISPECIES: hypothetical protein [Enterobacter]|uniref:hypothetical protein n=1 Tax=Enterobacter TaxID=547 RepID=UPI000EAC9906|nr:hypothetical protein [Enterobacter ludwigii]ELK6457627.1 hypothetical protein [Enterobacter ludwigii]MCE2009476.1 hypothetical protein [Enterobacter ludwigii]HEO9243824.1 hypothetical protein [Enterobacter ludwigii]